MISSTTKNNNNQSNLLTCGENQGFQINFFYNQNVSRQLAWALSIVHEGPKLLLKFMYLFELYRFAQKSWRCILALIKIVYVCIIVYLNNLKLFFFQIAHFKIPQLVDFVSTFPKTETGKIQKFMLRELFMKKYKIESNLTTQSDASK